MASIMFEGKISKIVSYIPWPWGSFSGGATSEEYPAPGLKTEPINSERETAIAVVDRYRRIVLIVMFPKLCMLVKEEIPDTREKNTNGTISSFSKLIKIPLPRLKT
tara:strand:- start:16 stop:333 length:318 start_codon:yes stop_codon:yes gene_type:complete